MRKLTLSMVSLAAVLLASSAYASTSSLAAFQLNNPARQNISIQALDKQGNKIQEIQSTSAQTILLDGKTAKVVVIKIAAASKASNGLEASPLSSEVIITCPVWPGSVSSEQPGFDCVPVAPY